MPIFEAPRRVGKSCLLMRFCDDMFTPSFISTIGIDFKIKTVTINGMKVKLQIWDTAGQERFRTITTDVQEWLQTISQQADPNVRLILVGNKCDSKHERALLFAQEKKMDFIEASAKEDICVDEIFLRLATSISNDLKKTESLSQPSSPLMELRQRGKDTRRSNPNPILHVDLNTVNKTSECSNKKQHSFRRCC
ncbi:hypothetical protein DI09_101p50 [Mitosporidium daphniae]|uniref:Uncharacterized protein n=1 Tax=Mitosporidium daphniae TaxID=1485682 RepID=A0A098VWD7_9MICR|nr:uncharacterized protein DI09_101p50 [Mitosporidium daphniae]KGG53230.1 hypothetical protein DI09_101p50 [Mitosporidium daphniae]|eukprot:XP_013239666.1 uncharacterized protein DI09_101p50 [Mitosporidium daphniae]